MVDSLMDKVAIVTGAGRGIGRGVALEMAAEGAKVVVVDPGVNVDGSGHDGSVAAQVAEEIRAAGGEAVPCMESVTTMEGGEKIVQTAVDNFGRLDIVVTCAGILPRPDAVQYVGTGMGRRYCGASQRHFHGG